MDTLQDRLAELAEDAPTGGVPAAELWARGTRAHRLRIGALAAVVALVGAVGIGIGVRVTDGDDTGTDIAPADTSTVALPIVYPAGADLPDLGVDPGPLAAIWLVPRGAGTLEVVGLVAETGTFGTLPIDDVSSSYLAPDAYFALSPDGRRIAYDDPADQVVVRDLVSGESYTPAFDFEIRRADEGSYTWVDATHLVGYHLAGSGGEGEGWVWQPGTAPRMVDLMQYLGTPYLGPNAGVYERPWFLTDASDSQQCLSLRDEPGGKAFPVLCDLVGVLGPRTALTHDGDGRVVALDAQGVDDPSLRHVVASAGAPRRVTFATDLIEEALAGADGGAS